MKTHLYAIAVVAILIASMSNASCVKRSLAAMGALNVALTGGK